MQRFRGGLVFKAHRLCVSLNSRLESNKEEENHAQPVNLRIVGESEWGKVVFKVHRILHHSTLGLRVIKKRTKSGAGLVAQLVESAGSSAGPNKYSSSSLSLSSLELSDTQVYDP